MPFSRSSTIYHILLYFLTILPTLVTSFDCTLANVRNPSQRSKACRTNYGDDTTKYRAVLRYGNCMLHQYSFSAFLQCSSQPGAPKLDGPNGRIAPKDILTRVLNPQVNPRCGNCKLARLIRNVANSASLTEAICAQYDGLAPGDKEPEGICCLAQCLNPDTTERSLKDFCDKGRVDLMNAPAAECGGGDGGGGGGGYQGDDPGPDPNDDTATDEATSTLDESTSTPTTATATSSSAEEDEEPTSSRTGTLASASETSVASTPVSTTSTGAAERVWVTGFEVLRGVGLAVLAMVVVR